MLSTLSFTYAAASTLSLLLVTAYVIYSTWIFNYWKKRNVPYLEPRLFVGSVANDCFYTHATVQLKGMYTKLKARGEKLGAGIFLTTSVKYLVISPEVIKLMVQKDYHHFTDRHFYYNEKVDPLSANMAVLGGQRWKILRTRVAPAFTPGRIKATFNNIVGYGETFRKAIHGRNGGVDVRRLANAFTTDAVAFFAFGIETNSFGPQAEFLKQGEEIFEELGYWRMAMAAISMLYPDMAKWLGFRIYKKETNDYFISVFKRAVEYREANGIVIKDALQLLIDLKNEWIRDNKNKDQAMVGLGSHAFAIYAAGFESSSSTITFCLYELSTNPGTQTKLRQEISRVLENHKGRLTYEAVMEMKYLSQVIDETLRKYPAVAVVERKCVSDYRIPNTEVTIEKGIEILAPVLGLHYDSDYFPDPDKFDPERFSEENKHNIVPFSYLPFGEGPRMCLGSRLGLAIVKVAVVLLVQDYEVALNESTKTPIEFLFNSATLMAKFSIYLDFRKLQD